LTLRDKQSPYWSVSSTVNVAAASYTNDIGDALLVVYWKESNLDRNERAFNDVRVLEFPTDHWTTFDATRKD
jgi:hypothetical protein